MRNPKQKNLNGTIWWATLAATLFAPATGLAEDTRPIPNDASPVLAMVNGRVITEKDVSLLAGDHLLKVKTEEYNAKHAILQRAIDDLVLHSEASRRNISLEDLLSKEAITDLKAPDRDELRTIYNSDKGAYADIPEEVAMRAIAERLRKQRLAELRRTYARSLWNSTA